MTHPSPATELEQTNQEFYDRLWRRVRLIAPQRFNTWPLVEQLSKEAGTRLEIAPGMRPRLPICGTCFADISRPALDALAKQGGHVHQASIEALPFPGKQFDLVCALDIIEHVREDDRALTEICRVAKPGAHCLLSVPLHMSFWTRFDDIVGHCRRYAPDDLSSLLARHGLSVEQSCAYGMQPKSSRLVDWAMDYMEKNPERAMWYYNSIFMPIGLRFQKALNMRPGMGSLDEFDEVILHCRLSSET
ncbi:class I SAM-dependent methyltransferase [Coraliomargarita parva]|uniref:class I SAM-dependent methyltransferase n=1 Tax=Coraliomargarita parva TaxID=3014050 RepID=UPI0022B431F9|nr:class I SAM-dependent methyltransferase [Coraliomargarita parva]